MSADEGWVKRRPFLWSFSFALFAASMGLALDILAFDKTFSRAFPSRLFQFVAVAVGLSAIEAVWRWFTSR